MAGIETAWTRHRAMAAPGVDLTSLHPWQLAAIDDSIIAAAEHDDVDAATELARSLIPDRAEMPLLDAVLERTALDEDLGELVVVGVLHLMGSVVPLVESILRLGVRGENVFLVGKAYSTNRAAVLALRSMGVTVEAGRLAATTTMIEPRMLPPDYEGRTTALAAGLVQRELAGRGVIGSKIVVLDDGGSAAEAITAANLSTSSLAIVEQTRRGVRLARRRGLHERHPVVNVAETPTKLVHESPLIGLSVAEQALARLGDAPVGVTVVGFGAVGEQVAQTMRAKGHDVTVVEPETTHARRAVELGYSIADFTTAAQDTTLMVGCTGTTWCTPEHLAALRPGTALASASSSDIEFAAARAAVVRRQPIIADWESRPDGVAGFERAHSSYEFEIPGGHAVLLNAGFPVNFDGSVDPIAAGDIQLTRALMLAGFIGAVGTSTPGTSMPPAPLLDTIDDFVD